MQEIIDLLLSGPAVAFYVAVLTFAAGHMNHKYEVLIGLLNWLATFLKPKPPAAAMLFLCLALAGRAGAADYGPVITTTSGNTYYRAADGKYYPLAFRPACVCGDSCKCKPGECPAKCPIQSAAPSPCANGSCGAAARPVYQFAPPVYFAPPSFQGCPDGRCQVPGR